MNMIESCKCKRCIIFLIFFTAESNVTSDHYCLYISANVYSLMVCMMVWYVFYRLLKLKICTDRIESMCFKKLIIISGVDTGASEGSIPPTPTPGAYLSIRSNKFYGQN